MNKFAKVTYEQFSKDVGVNAPDQNKRLWWGNLRLPTISSEGSAGCDFYLHRNIDILPHNKCKIATGVRWITDDEDKNKVLMVYPRSGLGCKYGLKLMNTVGIIDASYCNSDNEGHIILMFENPSDEVVHLEAGDRIAQGIIMEYTTPEDIEVLGKRNGGFGSSGR